MRSIDPTYSNILSKDKRDNLYLIRVPLRCVQSNYKYFRLYEEEIYF